VKLDRGPVMSMKDEAELGLAIHWIQQALISAFEDLLERVGNL